MNRLLSFVGIAVWITLSGCQHSLLVNLQTSSAAQTSFAPPMRFALTDQPGIASDSSSIVKTRVDQGIHNHVEKNNLMLTDEQPPLVSPVDNNILAADLLDRAKTRLIQQGYIFDPKNPDFLVSVSFSYGLFNYEIPPRSHTSSLTTDSLTRTSVGATGRREIWIDQPSSASAESSGYTSGSTILAIGLFIYPPDNKPQSASPQWQSTALTLDGQASFTTAAHLLFTQVLDQFPVPGPATQTLHIPYKP